MKGGDRLERAESNGAARLERAAWRGEDWFGRTEGGATISFSVLGDGTGGETPGLAGVT